MILRIKYFILLTLLLDLGSCQSNNNKLLFTIDHKIDSLTRGNKMYQHKRLFIDHDTLKCEFYYNDITFINSDFNKIVCCYLYNNIKQFRESNRYTKMIVAYYNKKPHDTMNIANLFDSSKYDSIYSYYLSYPKMKIYTEYILANVSVEELSFYDYIAANFFHHKEGVYHDFSFSLLLDQYAKYCATGEDITNSAVILLAMYKQISAHPELQKAHPDLVNIEHLKFFVTQCIPEWKYK